MYEECRRPAKTPEVPYGAYLENGGQVTDDNRVLSSGIFPHRVEGKVVPAWPDQHLAKLGKGSAGSPPAALGFYSAPKGLLHGLTMCIDFSDNPASFTIPQVESYLDTPGYSSSYAASSVHDYYYAVSNGQIDLENDVVGYYRAHHPKSWYEGLPGYWDRIRWLMKRWLTLAPMSISQNTIT